MPTFGVSWASRRIGVSIPAQPAQARNVAVKAVEIWNRAQLWFRTKYFPTGEVYTFLIDVRPTDVLVDFTDYWSVSNYCPSMPLGVEGCTNVDWNYSRNITQAIVFLDTTILTSPSNDSIFLALHEFGHALGLPDLPPSPTSPCEFQDLFCLYYADRYPSTLDLYALHQLADGNRQTTVSLPSNIPYFYYDSVDGSSLASTRLVGVSTNAKANVATSIQDLRPEWLATLVLAAVECCGIAIVLAFVPRRLKRHAIGS